jgi:hypothetical protein
VAVAAVRQQTVLRLIEMEEAAEAAAAVLVRETQLPGGQHLRQDKVLLAVVVIAHRVLVVVAHQKLAEAPVVVMVKLVQLLELVLYAQAVVVAVVVIQLRNLI